jgi:hypothetical protein
MVALPHTLCGVLVLDSGSLGFVWRYSPRSFYVYYLSSSMAQVNVTGKCKYTRDAHLYAFALDSSYVRSEDLREQ